MGKLKGNDLAFIAAHYEKISKAYATQIYFCFDNKTDGATAFNILKRVYAEECNYDAWAGWFGSGDKRDFYLGFTTKQVRNDVFDEIIDSISNYRQANPDFSSPDYTYTSTDSGEDSAGAKNYTTYIIIGVAAAIIIALLLWNRKKK